jgi:hypothetical protein
MRVHATSQPIFFTALLFTVGGSGYVYSQNLVQNPDFVSGLTGWSVIGFASAALNNNDGAPSPPAADVSEGGFNEAPAGALSSSCIGIDSSRTYMLSANVKIILGQMSMQVVGFADAACSGQESFEYDLLLSQADQWQSTTIPDVLLEQEDGAVQVRFYTNGGSIGSEFLIDHIFFGEQQATPVRLQSFGVD